MRPNRWLLIYCVFAACVSQRLSAQAGEPGTVTFELGTDTTFGPTTTSGLVAMRIGIHIERSARLTPESIPVDLLIQNVDADLASVKGEAPELMFAIGVMPLSGTSTDRKPVPLKTEFMRSAVKSPMGYRGGVYIPAKAAFRCKVDLARWFDLKAPGSYEVRICYSPTVDISEGYDIDKRCQKGSGG